MKIRTKESPMNFLLNIIQKIFNELQITTYRLKKFIKLCFYSLVVLLQNYCMASIEPTNYKAIKRYDSSLEMTLSLLDYPLEVQKNLIKNQDQKSFMNLKKIIFSRSIQFDKRWKSVIILSAIWPQKSEKILIQCLNDSQWFLRSSGLIALKDVNKSLALNWAKKSLKDPALMVRSKAIEILSEINDSTTPDLLWNALEFKENFRGGQSLWIREQIAQALLSLTIKKDTSKWIKIIQDPEPSLHMIALNALEQIYHKKINHLPIKDQIELWKKWWLQENNNNISIHRN